MEKAGFPSAGVVANQYPAEPGTMAKLYQSYYNSTSEMLASLAVFSIVALRTRLEPLIEVFFALTALVVFFEDQVQVSILILAVIWGLFRRIPARLMLPFLFYPPSWPVILIGFGVRKQMIWRADLLAVASVGFLFPFPAVIMSLLDFEFWRRWWMKRGNCGLIPAIPGIFLGWASYSVFQISFL